MEETSTTPEANNPEATQDSQGTDHQTDQNNVDNLDPSKSTDTSADGDKKPEDEAKNDAPASTLDDDLDDWIEKRKLPKPENDEQKQEYQSLRNAQRDYTRTQQAKKEAEGAQDFSKTVEEAKKDVQPTQEEDETDDEYDKRLKELEADRDAERNTRLQSEFYISNSVTEEQNKMILTVFKEEIARGGTNEEKLQLVEFWGSPKRLPTLLSMAKGRLAGSTDMTAATDEAARKERDRIARESQAKSPNRSATNTNPSNKSEDEARYERFAKRYGKQS